VAGGRGHGADADDITRNVRTPDTYVVALIAGVGTGSKFVI